MRRLFLCLFLFCVSIYVFQYQKKLTLSQQSVLVELRDEIKSLRQGKALVKLHSEEFASLPSLTDNSDRQRIMWMELLESEMTAQGILDYDFEMLDSLSLERQFDHKEPGSLFSAISVTEHPIKINATFLHEVHLINLLKSMLVNSKVLAKNNGCKISRRDVGIGVTCRLSFFDVRSENDSALSPQAHRGHVL